MIFSFGIMNLRWSASRPSPRTLLLSNFRWLRVDWHPCNKTKTSCNKRLLQSPIAALVFYQVWTTFLFTHFQATRAPHPTPGTVENLLAGAGNDVFQSTNPTTSNGGTETSNFNPFSKPTQPVFSHKSQPKPTSQTHKTSECPNYWIGGHTRGQKPHGTPKIVFLETPSLEHNPPYLIEISCLPCPKW